VDEARKNAILARVAGWLDAWPDDEPPPDGLEAELEREPVPDLAAMVAAVTACRHDVQIQGRSLKRLEERIGALADALRAQQERPSADTIELGSVLDLRDRVARCGRAARDAIPRLSFGARLGGAGRVVQSLVSAVELLREQVDDVLARAGVRAFAPDGEAFDPERMRAVGTAPAAPGGAPGTVASTERAGFARGDKVLRPAEVRVVREA
jgi:hypothetical protein